MLINNNNQHDAHQNLESDNLQALQQSTTTTLRTDQEDGSTHPPLKTGKIIQPSGGTIDACPQHEVSIVETNLGEGSKPLFQREDIAVNREAAALVDADAPLVANSNLKVGIQRRPAQTHKRDTSTESSSPERYRERTTQGTAHTSIAHRNNGGSTKRPTRTRRTSSPPPTPPSGATKRYSPDGYVKGKSKPKSVHYVHERREKDRLDVSSPKRNAAYFSNERHEKERARGGHGKASPKRRHRTESRSRSRSLSPPKKSVHVVPKRRSPEAVPYFIDEERELDRLKRIYGTTAPRHRRSYSRSRSRSPHAKPSTKALPASSRRSSRSPYRPYRRVGDRRRSLSGERRQVRSGALGVRVNERRRSRSISPTRNHHGRGQRRSRDREGHNHGRRHGSTERGRERSQLDNSMMHSSQHQLQPPQMPPQQPQIITIPVPVPEYTYAYGPWAPHSGWGARPPPPNVAFGMPPMMMPPYRMPPPYNMPPYNARQFRPQPRYGTDNYTPRTRGSYRGRNT